MKMAKAAPRDLEEHTSDVRLTASADAIKMSTLNPQDVYLLAAWA